MVPPSLSDYPTACFTAAGAQVRKDPPEVKMLTPQECALTSKGSGVIFLSRD